jgi:hypothetical protein
VSFRIRCGACRSNDVVVAMRRVPRGTTEDVQATWRCRRCQHEHVAHYVLHPNQAVAIEQRPFQEIR